MHGGEGLDLSNGDGRENECSHEGYDGKRAHKTLSPECLIPSRIWGVVVRDGAMHREATGGANQEGHGGLAGRRIVGEGQSNRKAGHKEMVILIVRHGPVKGARRLALYMRFEPAAR